MILNTSTGSFYRQSTPVAKGQMKKSTWYVGGVEPWNGYYAEDYHRDERSVTWRYLTLYTEPGDTITFEYVKDSSGKNGNDQATVQVY